MTSSNRVFKEKGFTNKQTDIFTPSSSGSSFPGWIMPSNEYEQVLAPDCVNKNDESLVLQSLLTRDSTNDHLDQYDPIQSWNFVKNQNANFHLLGRHLDFNQNTRSQYQGYQDNKIQVKQENYISRYSNQPCHDFKSRNIEFSDCQRNDVIECPKEDLGSQRVLNKITLLERSKKIDKELLDFFYRNLWKPQNLSVNLSEIPSQREVDEKNLQNHRIGHKNEQKMQSFREKSATDNPQNNYSNCSNKVRE